MRTSGAEPTEVGMVGVSAESAVHYTARQALCLMLTRVTRPRIRLSFTRIGRTEMPTSYIASAPRGAPRARLLEQASGRRACGVLCKELRDALASPR